MPDCCIQTVVTSPPYWGLRDYGVQGQIGLEPTPEEYTLRLVELFAEVRRVLRDDGTLWLNLGDCYSGSGGAHTANQGNPGISKSFYRNGVPRFHDAGRSIVYTPPGYQPKNLMGIPWLVALALQANRWYLRCDIIWAKKNCLPESVMDRPTRNHEYIFLLSKFAHYYYDAEAIKEPAVGGVDPGGVGYGHGTDSEKRGRKRIMYPGACNDDLTKGMPGYAVAPGAPTRNKRSVWWIGTEPFTEAHFATFPTRLIEPCILAGSSPQACPVCSSPWKRIVERKRLNRTELPEGDPRHRPNTYQGAYGDINGKADAGYTKTNTLGWQPTCTCPGNNGSGKSIVLDPFSGAGTSVMVALRHGRRGIGLELNPAYVEMSQRRIIADNPLFNGMGAEA
jgi:DNA modification methylase